MTPVTKPKGSGGANLLISVLSLPLAGISVFFFGELAAFGAFFGVAVFFRNPSLENFDSLLWGISGIGGIAGLWLRALAQPFVKKTSCLLLWISALLFVGSMAALRFVGVDFQIQNSPHQSPEGGALTDFGKGLLSLGVIAISIALHNIWLYLSSKRKVIHNLPNIN